MNANSILPYTKKPNFKTTINQSEANNLELRAQIHKNLPAAIEQAKSFAHLFKGPDFQSTCYKIWHFLRNAAYYKRDRPELQAIRLPNRFIYDTAKRYNSGDCKSFSLFTASILKALGYSVKFRYTSYKAGRPIPSHVYCIAIEPATGRQIIIDGCYPKFNAEKPYFYKKDYRMNVATLSGIEAPALMPASYAGARLSRRAGVIKAIRYHLECCRRARRMLKADNLTPERRYNLRRYCARHLAKVKALRLQLSAIGGPDYNYMAEDLSINGKRKRKPRAGLRKFGRGVAMVTLGVGRGAFLAVLALNLAGLATKMKNLQNTGRFKKVERTWLKLGGKMKLLQKAIDKGASRKPIVLNKRQRRKLMQLYKQQAKPAAVGVIEGIYGAGAGAAAAAALPIVAAIIPVIAQAFKKPAAGASRAEDKSNVKELQTFGNDILQTDPDPTTEGNDAADNYQDVDRSPGTEGEQPDEAAIEGPAVSQQAPGSSTGGGAKFSNLSAGLQQWAGKAFNFFGGLIKKRAKKKGKAGEQKVNQLARAGDDYFRGQFTRKREETSATNLSKLALPLGVAAVAVILATRKK